MTLFPLALGLACLGLLVAIVAAVRALRRPQAMLKTPTSAPTDQPGASDQTPFATTAIEQVAADVYALAFNVARTDYRILGQHQAVLAAAKRAVPDVVNEPRYFPRRPTLLPKLLRAINAQDSNRAEIVRLILQDPVLAGNVLKRANSVFYRQSSMAVESVDRAVVILGNEGLRAPVATAVMQPVFRLPKGFFDQFAPLTWELAQRTALAAETHARLHRTGDTFVAHLLGLLEGLGRIVLFRLTHECYRAQTNSMPRAEVFIRLMMDHGAEVARSVAAAWEMSPTFLEAIDAQIAHTPPSAMPPLARTLYFADLSGQLALLVRHGKLDADQAKALLHAQGMDADTYAALWPPAVETEFT
jgi:HD-like signal output (HDOD) protein